MVIKDRVDADHDDARASATAAAGVRAEHQMAHYLRRDFFDDPAVLVLNDLRLAHPGIENDFAQIDHLIIHRYGFVIVESKSVSEALRINDHVEWLRVRPRGAATGMASPVLQARRQGEVLRRVVSAQFDPTGRGWFRELPIDVLVAVSDEGRIERGAIDVPEVSKADAVPGRVKELIRRLLPGGKLFDAAGRGAIASRLVALHCPIRQTLRSPPSLPRTPPPAPAQFGCRHCGGQSLHAQHGKFG